MIRRLLDSPWPYFVGAGLLLIAAIASQFEIRLPSRPEGTPQQITAMAERGDLNVVFILIDTLRADRLGAYGHARDTSSTIDALASRGIRFDDVVSQSSWTKTSMASLWTATLPANHGVVRYWHVLPDDALMPAEIFKEAGYRTAGIWRNGWVAPNFGFGQGFDMYYNPKPGRDRLRVQSSHPSGGRTLKGTDEDLLASAFEFLDSFGRERFFLYLHFMDLHQYIYDEAAARFGNSYSDVYDQSIDWSDRLVGLLVNKLDGLGILSNTMIVIASDHGEAFQEHGFEGHARNLYGEVVRVPFIISLPFRLREGIVVENRVSNVDVWPTVLDLVGLPPLRGADGRSLVPLILEAAGEGTADDAPEERPRFAHLDRRWGHQGDSQPLVSVTADGKRIIYPMNQPKRAELFDLEADPAEQQNLYAPDDPESQRLAEMARRYYEDARSPWGADPGEVDLDELSLNQLRALGYVIR